MKRIFIIASLAIMAVGCQKTEIQNEIQNQIGFSTETGKMTRAIVQNGEYFTDQPFAVYAYGWQNISSLTPTEAPVMDNVKIVPTGTTTDGITTYTWKSETGAYYWPNDPRTTLNFYAYSPSVGTSKTHKELNGTVSHFERATATNNTSGQTGFVLKDYVHYNKYVDFMVTTPVVGATYSATDPNYLVAGESAGTVPVVFNHQMTQVRFNVTTNDVYPGIEFEVQNITLKNIDNKGTYTNTSLTHEYHTPAAATEDGEGEETTTSFKHGSWATSKTTDNGATTTYQVFPATKTEGAIFDGEADTESVVTLKNAAGTDLNSLASMTTTGVTMIPQTINAAITTPTLGEDSYAAETTGQLFMITYKVSGTGVATETVTKHVPFKVGNTNVANWGVNQQITYTVKIGLNEIYFEPSVATWDPTTGETYEFQQ